MQPVGPFSSTVELVSIRQRGRVWAMEWYPIFDAEGRVDWHWYGTWPECNSTKKPYICLQPTGDHAIYVETHERPFETGEVVCSTRGQRGTAPGGRKRRTRRWTTASARRRRADQRREPVDDVR